MDFSGVWWVWCGEGTREPRKALGCRQAKSMWNRPANQRSASMSASRYSVQGVPQLAHLAAGGCMLGVGVKVVVSEGLGPVVSKTQYSPGSGSVPGLTQQRRAPQR